MGEASPGSVLTLSRVTLIGVILIGVTLIGVIRLAGRRRPSQVTGAAP